MWRRLGLFSCFTPSHTPFPRQKACSTSEKILFLREYSSSKAFEDEYSDSKITFLGYQ
jgi:hypothetical protein